MLKIGYKYWAKGTKKDSQYPYDTIKIDLPVTILKDEKHYTRVFTERTNIPYHWNKEVVFPKPNNIIYSLID